MTDTKTAPSQAINEITSPSPAPAEVSVKKKIDVTQVTDYFDPTIFGQMRVMSQSFVKSNALPSNENEYTLLMKLQGGYEMGMKPLEAIKSFYFVNGAMNLFGSATMRRLREHGWRMNFKDEPNKCTATITKDDEEYTDTLTFEEADKSGWVKDRNGRVKAGWYEGANRKLKLRYGVASMLIKTYVPEVLGSATDIAEIAMDYDLGNDAKVSLDVPQGEEPATIQQVDTLTAMGIEIPEDLTREQATKLLTSKKS